MVTGGDVLTRLSRISGVSDSRWLRWPGPGFRRRRNAEEAVVGASLDAQDPLGYLPGYARVLAIMEWLHDSKQVLPIQLTTARPKQASSATPVMLFCAVKCTPSTKYCLKGSV